MDTALTDLLELIRNSWQVVLIIVTALGVGYTLAKRLDDLIGKDKDGDLKESDVRSNLRILDAAIKQRMAGPGDLVIITDPITKENSYEFSKGIKPEVREAIEKKRKEEFDKYINAFYRRGGEIPSVVQRVVNAFILSSTVQPASASEKQAPAPAQPKEGSTTKSAAEIDKLRADANEKIAQNPALAARVRAAFKRETGQDL